MARGGDRTIARMEDMASPSAYGDGGVRGRAFYTPDFWTDYRAAIPAVIDYLQGLA